LLRSFALVGAGALAVFGVALATGVPAQAAATTRFVATTGSDTENDCTDQTKPCKTIQYAVGQANAGDKISIGSGTYDESVDVRISLTIVGAGSTGSGRTTVAGNGEAPSIYVDGIDTETTPDVTLENLDVSGNTADEGIRVEEATARNTDSVVSDNKGIGVSSNLSSATIALSGTHVSGNQGGGVWAFAGSVVVDDSTVSDNNNGGLVVGGTGTVANSTFDGNIGAGVVVNNSGGTVAISASTISDSVPFPNDEEEGARLGVGLLVESGRATVSESTISGNTGQGVLSVVGSTAIGNSTVSGTKPGLDEQFPSGGVVALTDSPLARGAVARPTAFGATTHVARQLQAAGPDETSLSGTIVARQAGAPDCDGTMTDSGYSLDSDGSCALSETGSVSKGNAKLGALGNHGGPTQTQVPAKGSQAIDAIPVGPAGCAKGATDQRGVSRPQAARCDIGAVEVAQPALVIAPTSLPHATVGTAYHVAFSASGGLGAPYTFSLAPGSSLPPGLSLSSTGVLSGTPTKSGSFTFSVSVDDPVTKAYTLVVAAAAGPNGAGTQPIANTGAPVAAMGAVGAGAVFAGFLLLYGAGLIGRRPGRHRG
jgi:Putative Ig domain.